MTQWYETSGGLFSIRCVNSAEYRSADCPSSAECSKKCLLLLLFNTNLHLCCKNVSKKLFFYKLRSIKCICKRQNNDPLINKYDGSLAKAEWTKQTHKHFSP